MNRLKALLLLATLTALVVWAGQLVSGTSGMVLDTVVGERGVILSGGQKQRITLARCLLQDTPILLLDDPVSQVDLETGMAIIDTIRSAVGRKTVIIVSHRLSACGN